MVARLIRSIGEHDEPRGGQEKRGYTYAEAMAYLGVKRRAFDTHIRPRLPPPTPCGTTRVFERTDLDRAWEQYRASRGTARNLG